MPVGCTYNVDIGMKVKLSLRPKRKRKLPSSAAVPLDCRPL
jgi:uncharacterized OB-fold protein